MATIHFDQKTRLAPERYIARLLGATLGVLGDVHQTSGDRIGPTTRSTWEAP